MKILTVDNFKLTKNDAVSKKKSKVIELINLKKSMSDTVISDFLEIVYL